MSEGYVKRLLNPADTLGVLRTIMIQPGDLLKGRLMEKERNNQTFQYVPRADHVSYFDLRVDSMNDPPVLKMHIESQPVSSKYKTGKLIKTWKNLRPCYYLPYTLNGSTRMKLTPPDDYGEDDINFFTTAAIDGCSVYVEGPAQRPTVTHLNAASTAPPPPMPRLLALETAVQKQQRIDAKIQVMDQRMNLIKKGQATVVERPDYMEDFDVGRTQVMQIFAQRMGIPLQQVEAYMPIGSVVGIRNAQKEWKFFVQKGGLFKYNKPPNLRRQWQSCIVLSALEFWPANMGGFRVLQ